MAGAKLTISSRNYSSWSLRAWLFCQLAELDVEVESVSIDDPTARAELLLLSPTVLTPRLDHNGASIWDTIAIAEYLEEEFPNKGLLPLDKKPRSHARSIIGEMHGGFYNLRSALPMNLRATHKHFKVFSGARPDIQRIKEIWSDCLNTYGGPFLFGAPSVADAMYAPVCTRFRTYAVDLEPQFKAYCETIFAWGPMQEWTAAAALEPDEIIELEVEF